MLDPEHVRCIGCGSRYAIDDGVPLLAVHGTAETWGKPPGPSHSGDYQSEFRELERAAAYNLQFQRRVLKLGTTRRERAIIGRHFRRLGSSRVVLDLPCGGGRMTPAFAGSTGLVIEADIAPGQIRYGRTNSAVATPQVWITASAFHIPLRSRSVDGAICVRLSHHLTDAEQERLFIELLRVSRRFVIVSFFDRFSLKYLTRSFRHPFKPKPPKPTMTVERVSELAIANGGRLVDAPRLSRIGSGHRYALIIKEDTATPAATPASP